MSSPGHVKIELAPLADDIINISSDSSDEELNVEQIDEGMRNSLRSSCMFGTHSRDAFPPRDAFPSAPPPPPLSHHLPTATQQESQTDIEIVDTILPEDAGQSSNNPIVLSDSPPRSAFTEHHHSSIMNPMLIPMMMDDSSRRWTISESYVHNNNIPESIAGALRNTRSSTHRYMPYTHPHLEYHFRLSFPPVSFNGVSVQENNFPGMLGTWTPPETNTGASQTLIEKCTIKTKFIKRMPAKTKQEDSQRQLSRCTICLDEFVDKVKIRRLPCFHMYHVKCIDVWLKTNQICPVCRKPITAK